MNPSHTDALREARDFLSELLDASPQALIDLLSANAENLIERWDKALAHEAYPIGLNVIAQPEGFSEFAGSVVGHKTENGAPLFTVKDQEGDAFDCVLGELRPNTDA